MQDATGASSSSSSSSSGFLVWPKITKIIAWSTTKQRANQKVKSGYDKWKRNVLRLSDVTCDGRLLQKLAPETGKARFPTVERLNGGTASWLVTRAKYDDRYAGALPFEVRKLVQNAAARQCCASCMATCAAVRRRQSSSRSSGWSSKPRSTLPTTVAWCQTLMVANCVLPTFRRARCHVDPEINRVELNDRSTAIFWPTRSIDSTFADSFDSARLGPTVIDSIDFIDLSLYPIRFSGYRVYIRIQTLSTQAWPLSVTDQSSVVHQVSDWITERNTISVRLIVCLSVTRCTVALRVGVQG